MGFSQDKYDFELYGEPEMGGYDFEGFEPIVAEELSLPIKRSEPSPTLSAIGQTLKGMFYGEGLPEGIGYLQKPVEAIGDLMMSKEDEESFKAKYPNLMAARYALASLLPGGKSLASPIEAELFQKQPIELQRLEILGETALWAATPVIAKGAGQVASKLLKKMPWFERNWDKPIGQMLKDSTWFRRMTNRERGLIIQTVDDMQKTGVSDGAILRSLNKQGRTAEFQQFKDAALAKRMAPESPIARQPGPIMDVVDKIRPVPPSVPKTPVGKEFQEFALAERVKSPLAVLSEKETALAIVPKGKYDFEAGLAVQQGLKPERFLEQPLQEPEKGDTTLYGGFPVPAVIKLSKQLVAKYDSAIGEPVWTALSEDLPVWAGKKSNLIDRVNKGLIYDYRKDPAYIELRDDTNFKIQQAGEKVKELAQRMTEFPKAEQVRIAQIIQGSVTATPERYKDALWVAKEFQRLETELQDLEILGKDNSFRQLNRKEIAGKFNEIDTIDTKIEVLKTRLEPIIRTARTSRRVSEEITEEIISASEDVTEGLYEINVTKWSELNEQRIMEALTSRGFAEGEATQMLNRVKESVVSLGTQKGTLKEIRTTIEKVVTKTIIQEVEKLKTYSPSMMARARGSLIKDIGIETKRRTEILKRIKLHYTMSGKQYLRRAYRSIEEEKKLSSNILRFLKGPRLSKEYAIRRKDLSYLYRKELGQIMEAPYLVYKGLSAETRDVELMRMFTKISENRNWAIAPEEWVNIQNIKSRAHLLKKYENFKPLPKTDKLGPLSGALVDPYIWDDLNQAVKIEGDFIKAWDSVLTLWKTGKVVFNPATQVRNFLSNVVLADFSGLPPHRIDIYARTARDMLTKSGYWKEAKQTPLLGTEWAGAEIKRFLANAQELKSGNMLVRSAELFKTMLDVPGKLYQGNEQFFKLAVFINERMAGKSIKDAAKHAEKGLFNYQKIPPTIRQLKRWYAPFITFSYKALPRFAETAIRKPWKIAKYAILMAGVEEITRRMYGESKEEIEREKRVLPDYMRKSLLPGQLSHLRIPYKDEYNRSKYLDLSYIMPWGDIAEQWGQSRIVGRPLLPTHPFIVAPMQIPFNELMFTGEPLTLGSDDWLEYSKKIGAEIWRQAMPSLVGSYSFNKLMSAWKGELDWQLRDRSMTEAIFDVFLGLKIRSIDYTEQLAFRLKEHSDETSAVETQFNRKYSKLLRTPGDNSKKMERLLLDYSERIDRLFEQMMDFAR